ncbi:MAG: protein translocase subunit SecD [Cyanobacteria bacterium NC_groundwater_1444_Ag_S-0.65um_54_12]|nr:protein translocase subunit SecD [Cyanobacteria bacterium NC_groundwater_1444_Ag_S-0.65um_54_12]
MYVVQEGRQFPFKLGLDIQGGMHLVLEAKDTAQVKVSDQVMVSVVQVIRNRVDQYGVAEPVIQRKGERQVVIDMPGLRNPDEARSYLGKTAQLVFMEPLQTSPVKAATESAWSPTPLTGKMLMDAKAQPVGSGIGGGWEVQLKFNPEGAKLFGELTSKYVEKQIAIQLDDKIISAPRVNEPILQGDAVITGGFSAREAQLLASQLKAGALPVPLVEVENRVVGASLGTDTVTSAIRAGVVGFVLVVLFMLLYYRIPGLVADLALAIYAILVLAIFKLIPVTLTVPGIAGFILSIGMAVDANVLIFERTKEELKRGRSLYSAIEIGFKRAFTAIFDSNSTTLLTCAILYSLGTGLVKGFALTLAIGVLCSLFTAITVTRALLHQILEAKGLKHPTYFGVKL